MGYKLMYKENRNKRAENYTGKIYPTKNQALKERDKAIQMYKNSKYGKLKPSEFKIVKSKPQRTYGVLGASSIWG